MILAGKMLAQAAVAEGWNATYIPAYGAEVRGGTAHCHVKIGHRQIGSPIVEDATIVVAMNEPSYQAFCPLLRKGSTLVVNSSLVPSVGKHAGVKIVSLELTKIAADMGSLRSANMLVFGLCAGLLGLDERRTIEGPAGRNSRQEESGACWKSTSGFSKRASNWDAKPPRQIDRLSVGQSDVRVPFSRPHVARAALILAVEKLPRPPFRRPLDITTP